MESALLDELASARVEHMRSPANVAVVSLRSGPLGEGVAGHLEDTHLIVTQVCVQDALSAQWHLTPYLQGLGLLVFVKLENCALAERGSDLVFWLEVAHLLEAQDEVERHA